MERFIEKVYEAPLDLSAWSEAVDSVAAVVGAAGAGQFHIFDSTHRRMLFTGVPAWVARDIDTTYNERFAATDPRRQLAETRGPGEWIFDQDHFDSRYVSRSELFEFLIRSNIRYTAGATLHASNGVIAALGVFRSPDQRPFGLDDRAALGRLTTHLMRAANLTMKLADLRAKAAVGVSALDALADALFITDARSRIVFQNRAAEELLREANALGARGGLLRAVNTEDSTALTKAVMHAAEKGIGSGALPVEDRDRRCALLCRVLPLSERSLLQQSGERRVLLVFRRTRAGSGQLRTGAALFSLTRAEAQVAKGLINGSTPREISSDLGISLTTVRSHLKQLLRKTNTRRQAELAAVFSSANLAQ